MWQQRPHPSRSALIAREPRCLRGTQKFSLGVLRRRSQATIGGQFPPGNGGRHRGYGSSAKLLWLTSQAFLTISFAIFAPSRRLNIQSLHFCLSARLDPSKPSIRRIAQELAGAARQFEWSWAARHEQVRLFSPGEAPGNIASACLAPPRKFDVLESLGMGGGKASGGLAAHAWLRAVAMARETFSREAPDLGMVDAVMECSHGPDGLTYPEPRFRAALAEALLLPWIARRAPKEIKEKVTSFVLKHFNDPRLPMNTKDWIGVSEDASSVMRKWLTGFALEQFFVVVGHVAQEHMWRYRKAFWLAYYNANVIDDGWVLFGLEASYYARDAFDKTQ
ncbi:MAG: EH signature domain-containing protein, partial [Methylocella sp.]